MTERWRRLLNMPGWLPTSIDKAAAALGLVAFLAVTSACTPVNSAGMEAARPIIHLDDTGKLVYVPDEKGNVIPDFSDAGYGGGGVPIPDVPVKAVVGPGRRRRRRANPGGHRPGVTDGARPQRPPGRRAAPEEANTR